MSAYCGVFPAAAREEGEKRSMIKVAIVEDDKAATAALRDCLASFGAQSGEFFSVACYSGAEQMLQDAHGDSDLIFLDIKLPGMNGIEAAKRLRRRDDSVVIVFVTSMAQLAVYGYEVEAADYIVKPLVYESFALKMNRIVRLVHTKCRRNAVTVSSAEGVHVFETSKIRYIEVIGHHLIYHNDDGDVDVCGNLGETEKRLAPYGFALCNRCYLVNLNRVSKIEGDYVTVDGEKLLISRRKRREFSERLSAYLGGGGV